MNRFFIVFVLILEIFVCTYAKCPEGMISSFSDNSICFLLVSQKQSYLIAEKYCNQQNGHLTSIHDGIDNALIREEAQKNFTDSTSGDFWIGINNLETSGFTWFDKTPLDFFDWDKGQPQNSPGYNCGAVKLQGGAWITDDCDKLKSSVCIIKTSHMTTTTTVQGKTTLKPKACPASWTYYDVTGFCYLVVNETLQWGDAEDWCFSHGGHLASIHSLAENTFVTNMIPFDPNEHGCNTKQWAYIGLYSVTNQTSWRWTDDSPFDYSAWAPGHPYFKQSLCGIIWNGPPCGAPLETWADDVCFELNQHFICKKPPN